MRNISCRLIPLSKLTTYDLICEKVPHGETNSVILDQLFHTFVIVFMVKTAQGITKMLAADAHE